MAVNVSASVSQGLFGTSVPVEGLERIVQSLVLQCKLLLCKLHPADIIMGTCVSADHHHCC